MNFWALEMFFPILAFGFNFSLLFGKFVLIFVFCVRNAYVMRVLEWHSIIRFEIEKSSHFWIGAR